MYGVKFNSKFIRGEYEERKGKKGENEVKFNSEFIRGEYEERKGKKGERRKGMGKGMGKGLGDDGVVVELGREDEERKRP